MKKAERRFVAGAQVRATKGDTPAIEGYCAVFGQDYVMWDDASYTVRERIKPGAFGRVIEEKQDVRCLFNHSADNVLGRTTNQTFRLTQDDQGLHFENDLDLRTSIAQNVQAFIERGDVTGCSFSFTVSKENWTTEKQAGKTISTREIEEVEMLYDGGPVTYPAYTGTSVGARTEMRSALLRMPALPAEVRTYLDQRAAADDAGEQQPECGCRCRACYGGDHEECEMYMAQCGDPNNCDHECDRSARSKRSDKPTKRVDGEDLTSDCFIYVGDAQKPATWALPWKFKSDAKKKSHLRNALARFSQTKKIPSDAKDAAWKKLVRLCKKYGITITDDESKSLGLTVEQRDTIGGGKNCQCDCPECQVGDCAHCSDPDCDDDQCNHDGGDHADEDSDRAVALVAIDTRMRQAGLKVSKV